MILLLDDDPVQRLIAERDLRKLTSKLIIPERAIDLPNLDISRVALVICDRWLGSAWKTPVYQIVEQIPEVVPVWEWTCDEWTSPLMHRVSRTLHKRPGELYDAVRHWIAERKL